MTKEVDGVRLDTLTTRQLMEIRVIWHLGVREFCGLFDAGRTCNHCQKQGLVFAWETLEVYKEEKDDLGRGLVMRDARFYCKVEAPVLAIPFL
eukprot:4323178-Heterocapsa_arctica.AAC.1